VKPTVAAIRRQTLPRRQNRYWLALVIASAALVSACSSHRVKPLNTDFAERNWAIRRSTLLAVQNFNLQGRLSESGLTGVRGELNWVQTGRQFEVRFYGPLGVGAATITGNPKNVEIRTKDGTFTTDQPEALMQEKLGWSLPLASLQYWLLGLPTPIRGYEEEPRDTVKLDDAGRPQTIKQLGWKLDYDEYQTVGIIDLPRKIVLANGDRSFRIVVDQWSGTP
jgi:outer membrane lipoprotein LolB